MQLPPGPLYLLRILLRAFPATLVVYGALCLQGGHLSTITPSSFVVLALAYPVLVYTRGYWSAYQDRVDAAAREAVLVPRVAERGLKIRAGLVNSIQSGYPGDAYLPWRDQYGETFLLRFLGENRVVTFEPEHIKAILATQFERFEKGSVLHGQFYGFLGSGVFNSDGNMWKFHRSMTRPFFNRERVSDFDIFDRHANDAIGQAADRLAAGYPIDFQDMASRFTLDSATEFLFGRNVRTLSAGLRYPVYSPLANSPTFMNHPSNKFANAFTAGQHLTALRTRYGPTWPLMEFWKDKVSTHRKVVDDFIQPILTEALDKRAALSGRDAPGDCDDETLLSHLVESTQDSQILLDELVNLLVAGRDTTSTTLTFAAYMLTQHPDITRRLREEISNTVGHCRPTLEQMKEMKYLRAFINETLRLYPPVPANNRTSNQATVWPTPGGKAFYIPANTKIIYGVFWMHRRKDLWGPDADVFDPDRFLDERLHKYLTPNPFIFLPFNAGPRICLGQQFAYHEVSFFLIRLLQKWSSFSLALDAQPEGTLPPPEWSKCSGTKGTDKIWPGSHLTLYVRGGLWVRMGDEMGLDSGQNHAG